ncbi:hypothetical protein EV198_2611 [Roseivirga ehrenbergii]|nr:hypothetical protein EV198_2611 [Roseivirga ehrenbergii]
MPFYKVNKKHSDYLKTAVFNKILSIVIFFIQYYATHSTLLRMFVYEKVEHLKG